MLSEGQTISKKPDECCLNPCFNGICSLRKEKKKKKILIESLNPCFNGICSLRGESIDLAKAKLRLNPCFNGICSLSVEPFRAM